MHARAVRAIEARSSSGRSSGLQSAPSQHLLAAALASLSACTVAQFARGDGGEPSECGAAPCDAHVPAPTDDPEDDDAGAAPHDEASMPGPGDAGVADIHADGDASGPVEGDDGAVAEPSERSPRELLEGRYALRARFYGKDVATGTQYLSQQLIWLAKVREGDDGGLELLAEVCEDRGEGTGLFVTQKISAILVHPKHVAVRRFILDLENDSFSTRGNPFLIGYREQVPECKDQPGASIVTSEGACVCPTSSQPPTRPNDCRVYDSDMDGNPGYAVELTGGINRVDHVRHKDQSQLKNGKVAPDRHHTATYSYNHDHYTLECGQRDCPTSEYKPCLPEESRVLFYPIDDLVPNGPEWTCEEVLQRSETGDFFPLTPLARDC